LMGSVARWQQRRSFGHRTRKKQERCPPASSIIQSPLPSKTLIIRIDFDDGSSLSGPVRGRKRQDERRAAGFSTVVNPMDGPFTPPGCGSAVASHRLSPPGRE
jgi:hypothetical protein